MQTASQKIKAKLSDFARLFSIERNSFQRFVIVYKYIRFLNTDPVAKNILQNIFDDTAKFIGEPDKCMDEDKFIDVKGEALFSREFWIYYSNLEIIYGKMKKMKNCCINDKKEFNKLCQLFSKPYSKKMLELSFTVVNSNIFDQLDQKCFFCDEEPKDKTWFDEKKSVLYIKGEVVRINIQDKVTNAHKILNHIFITNKDNITDDFYYSEIAEDEFGDMEYKLNSRGWEKYRVACRDIQNKIKDQTNSKIKNFLIFNTGRKGRVKINKKYL